MKNDSSLAVNGNLRCFLKMSKCNDLVSINPNNFIAVQFNQIISGECIYDFAAYAKQANTSSRSKSSNSAKISSIVSPPARYSKILSTG